MQKKGFGAQPASNSTGVLLGPELPPALPIWARVAKASNQLSDAFLALPFLNCRNFRLIWAV